MTTAREGPNAGLGLETLLFCLQARVSGEHQLFMTCDQSMDGPICPPGASAFAPVP